jgi:PelA/Pel-15E family pectate lyase
LGLVGTFDNGATTTEIRYLAKVQAMQTTDRAAMRDSIVRGLDLLIAAQYPNGGWPQNYPLSGGYHDAITLNDDAMLQIVRLLYDVGHRRDGDFAFVDDAMRARAKTAAEAGIAWFVAQQVRIGGRRTLWGQQHDALTQLPTAARAFEMPALASSESVRIVDFLMTLPEPDADVRAAVYAAADFLRASRIDGKRWRDGELLDDPQSSVWARFYALDVYEPEASHVDARVRPLFGDRPQPHGSRAYGLVFGTLRAVSAERRRGYAQYNRAAEALLRDFDVWCARYPR